jgi:hypothetical protein
MLKTINPRNKDEIKGGGGNCHNNSNNPQWPSALDKMCIKTILWILNMYYFYTPLDNDKPKIYNG